MSVFFRMYFVDLIQSRKLLEQEKEVRRATVK